MLDTLKIQNVSDECGYLDSIGRKQSAEVIKKARIAEARCEGRQRSRATPENRQRARLSRSTAEMEIREAETRAAHHGRPDARSWRCVAEEVGR